MKVCSNVFLGVAGGRARAIACTTVVGSDDTVSCGGKCWDDFAKLIGRFREAMDQEYGAEGLG